VAARMLGCAEGDVTFANNEVHGGGKAVKWADLTKQAYMERVGLSVTGFYMTPEIKYDFATLNGRAFYYYCYGAAVSEVEIDTRTGEWWLKAVDIVHDVGRSINPALDKGQVGSLWKSAFGTFVVTRMAKDGASCSPTAPALTRFRWRATFPSTSMSRCSTTPT
jgi:xanthine dehydrogenase large subunit